ncbi:hypothetical protein CPAR01_10668, partial [Colletotrichum paranaense]
LPKEIRRIVRREALEDRLVVVAPRVTSLLEEVVCPPCPLFIEKAAKFSWACTFG